MAVVLTDVDFYIEALTAMDSDMSLVVTIKPAGEAIGECRRMGVTETVIFNGRELWLSLSDWNCFSIVPSAFLPSQ